jgi:predicted nucleic acid-binding protein
LKGIADTGFLVAFANRNDAHHEWAVRLAGQVSEPLVTCDAVLAEAAFHLGSTALVLEFVRQGLVLPLLTIADHLPRLLQIAERFADQAPDLADICIIRLSELYPHHSVITTDLRDFRVYRRNRNEVIPLIVPAILRRK